MLLFKHKQRIISITNKTHQELNLVNCLNFQFNLASSCQKKEFRFNGNESFKTTPTISLILTKFKRFLSPFTPRLDENLLWIK